MVEIPILKFTDMVLNESPVAMNLCKQTMALEICDRMCNQKACEKLHETYGNT